MKKLGFTLNLKFLLINLAIWYLPPANTIFAQWVSPTQNQKDDELLKDYFAKNYLHPLKSENGVYFLITQKGTGDYAKGGDQVKVNYTGKTLNGKIFDSNTDTAFHHVTPLNFTLGAGKVIAGCDEGLTYFNIGCKGKLFVPSGLAFGY